MSTRSRTNLHARDAHAILGILKRLGPSDTYVLGAVAYTPTELAALFQSRIDSGRKVEAKRAEWLAAVEADRALGKKVDAAYLGLREIVRQRFDNAPDALADFGMTPRKVGKLDPLGHVVAAEKRRATRKARNTMGPKQRLAVHGSVTPADIGRAVAAAMVSSARGVVSTGLVPVASAPALPRGAWVNVTMPAGGPREVPP